MKLFDDLTKHADGKLDILVNNAGGVNAMTPISKKA